MAYNYSIYLMAGMPYLLLGAFGFLVYRGRRLNSAAEQQAPGDPLQAGEGGNSCPSPSTDEVS
jgi:hypothetical protein